MATRKGKLIQLMKAHHHYRGQKNQPTKREQKKKAFKIKAKHFDEGMSINLAYSLDMYPETLYPSYHQPDPSVQMGFADDTGSEAFFVEPFEEETIEVPFREISDKDEEKLDKIVKVEEEAEKAQDEKEEVAAPVADYKEEAGSEVGSEEIVINKDETATPSQSPDPEQEEIKEELLKPDPGDKEATPKLEQEKVQPYEVSDEEFASDIGAILKGEKVFDPGQKKTVSSGETTKLSSPKPGKEASVIPPSKPSEDALDPNKNEHQIFEKIAQSMQYANSYDLGAIAMEEKFDNIEKEIDQEEVKKVLKGKRDKDKAIQEAEVLTEDEPSKVQEPAKGEALGPGTVLEKYPPDVPLDIHNGGRIIKADQLQTGDLILISSGEVLATASDSAAGIYLGGDRLLVRGEGDILEEKPIQNYISGKGTIVALRHEHMTGEKAANIVETLSKLRPLSAGSQPESWVKIHCPSINIHPSVCDEQEEKDKDKCHSYAGKINLGTTTNDSFLSSQSMVKVFADNGLNFTQGNVPDLIRDKSFASEHNGSLKYTGHLKN